MPWSARSLVPAMILTVAILVTATARASGPDESYEYWKGVLESARTAEDWDRVPAECFGRYIREMLLESYRVAPPISDSPIEKYFARARVTGPGARAFSARNAEVGALHGGFRMSVSRGKHVEAMGSVAYPGIHGIVFVDKTPAQAHRMFLTYIDILRRGAFASLRPEQAGIALHMQFPGRQPLVFWTFDLSRMKAKAFRDQAPEAYRKVLDHYRAYFKAEYAERLKLSPEVLERLDSITAAVEDRSYLFLKTKQSFTHVSPDGISVFSDRRSSRFIGKQVISERKAKKKDYTLPGIHREMPLDLGIEGGALMVFSENADELLPAELLTGMRVKRVPGERWIEVSRNVVSQNASPETSRTLIQHLASIASGEPKKADRIAIFVSDEAHRRLFERWGFKALGPDELEPIPGAAASSELAEGSLLSVKVDDFLSKVMSQHFPDGAADSPAEREAILSIFGVHPSKRKMNPERVKQAEEALRDL